MKNLINKWLVGILGVSFLLTSCMSDADIKSKIKQALKDDPTILAEAVKANPADFMEALQEAAKTAQGALAKKRKAEEDKKLEEAFDKPLVPVIRKDETFRGSKDGVITLVEYSDFECPYCSRGFKTVQGLLDKYKGKIRFVYKHLPLSFHKNAKIASQYYEAIRLQDEEKAFKFHDLIYERQQKLRNGEKFLKALAKEVGADMKKVAKDYKSKAVLDRIAEDEAEAAKFGMQGTPGFLLNGVPVRGAYPVSHFEGIVDKLVSKGKLKL